MSHWRRAYESATIAVDTRELAPLVEGAASLGVDPATMQLRIDSLGGRISRVLRERIVAFPGHVARLKRLRELDAPAVIVENELWMAHRALALAAPRGDDEIAELEDPSALDFRALFEAAIELAVVDPWAENAGLGRLYERLLDELPKSVAMPLIDSSWPVHIENLEGMEACVYGSHGFTIFLIDDETAAAEGRAALLSFEPAPETLRAFAVDRVVRELEDERTDLQAEEEDEELDYEAQRRRSAERLAPERVRASVVEVETEWRARKSALLAALAEVAAGRAALLEWDAKNPSL